MSRTLRDDAVKTLREHSLLAGSLAWHWLQKGYAVLAARYDEESDRLWERADELARIEVTS